MKAFRFKRISQWAEGNSSGWETTVLFGDKFFEAVTADAYVSMSETMPYAREIVELQVAKIWMAKKWGLIDR
jgi:hypothetical protein